MELSICFLTGFFGSLHCVGMCGAIVLACASRQSTLQCMRPGPLTGALSAHLVYNTGRVLSYAVVGAVAGLIGGMVTSIRPGGTWFTLAAGILTALAGMLLLWSKPWSANAAPALQSWFRKVHLNMLADLLAFSSLESRFYVGLLTPLLPCGLLYAMVMKAAETGTAAAGGLTMLAFGAGIVPALLLTGVVSSLFSLRFRLIAGRLAGVAVLLLGMMMILRATGMHAMPH